MLAKASAIGGMHDKYKVESTDKIYSTQVKQLDSILLKGNPQKALEIGFNLVRTRDGVSDPLDAKVFYILYCAASQLEQYSLMIKLLPIVKRLEKQYGYSFGMYSVFYDLQAADIDYRLGDYEQALKAYYKVLPKTTGDRVHFASINNNIGLAYQRLKMRDSAEYYFDKALKTLDDSSLPFVRYTEDYARYFRKVIVANQIPILLEKKQYNKALRYSMDELIAARANNDTPVMMSAYRDQAKIYYGMGKNDLAATCTDSIFSMLKSHKNTMMEQDAYHLQSLIYAAAGRVDDALESSARFNAITDSISHSAKKRSLYNESFFNDIKLWQFRASEASNNLENITSQKNKYRTAFTIILFLGFAACLLVYSNYKRNKLLKRKNSRISRLLQEKELLFDEMHHRIKNNLQTVSSMIYLSSKKHKNTAVASEMDRIIMQLESVGSIHDLLRKQESGKEVNIRKYLDSLIDNHLVNYPLYRVDIHREIDDLIILVDLAVPIGLIISELMTNSFKHAFVKEDRSIITIKLMIENETELILYYSDHQISDRVIDSNQQPGVLHGIDLIDLLIEELGAIRLETSDGTYDLKVRIPLDKFQVIPTPIFDAEEVSIVE